MLEENGISIIQLLQRQHKESLCTKTQNYIVPFPSPLEVLQKASNPLQTSMYNDSKSK